MTALPYNISLFADQETWIAAYAAWYAHFFVMLPPDCPYRLAESWTRKMTEASMGPAFFQRDDQKAIAENGMLQAVKNLKSTKQSMPPYQEQRVSNFIPMIHENSQKAESANTQMTLF
ncbi:hypothetical protein ACJU26_05920 [Acidithiobacillus sp. M4-SHS-6]|uniref:hypothetical protein n=1 Tax=Acidithiobacillus sp. M4-SHS-6 TaxID=3383024 RepID=UPI0039BDCBC6